MLAKLSDKAFFEQPISSRSDLAESLAEVIAFAIPQAITNITGITALLQHSISTISIKQFCGVILQLEDIHDHIFDGFLSMSLFLKEAAAVIHDFINEQAYLQHRG